jgi:hypothetical protein
VPDDPRGPPEAYGPPSTHPPEAEKWRMIRSALESWAQTTPPVHDLPDHQRPCRHPDLANQALTLRGCRGGLVTRALLT